MVHFWLDGCAAFVAGKDGRTGGTYFDQKRHLRWWSKMESKIANKGNICSSEKLGVVDHERQLVGPCSDRWCNRCWTNHNEENFFVWIPNCHLMLNLESFSSNEPITAHEKSETVLDTCWQRAPARQRTRFLHTLHTYEVNDFNRNERKFR